MHGTILYEVVTTQIGVQLYIYLRININLVFFSTSTGKE